MTGPSPLDTAVGHPPYEDDWIPIRSSVQTNTGYRDGCGDSTMKTIGYPIRSSVQTYTLYTGYRHERGELGPMETIRYLYDLPSMHKQEAGTIH